jgi:hypothetical protein
MKQEYLRQLGVFMVEVKDVLVDTPSPNRGREAASAVLMTIGNKTCPDGLLIDAKWNISGWDGKKPRFTDLVLKSLQSFKMACGVSTASDTTTTIGKRVIVLVEPRDQPEKRYWNVTKFWPAIEWAEQFPGDTNFGTDQGVGF